MLLDLASPASDRWPRSEFVALSGAVLPMAAGLDLLAKSSLAAAGSPCKPDSVSARVADSSKAWKTKLGRATVQAHPVGLLPQLVHP